MKMPRPASLAIAAVLLATQPLAASAQDAGALRAKIESLRGALADNAFHRPLALESNESSKNLKGDVYAIVERPFGVLEPALRTGAQWCDLLILHLNVKNCSIAGQAPAQVLSLVVGRKVDQAISDAYTIEFKYKVAASTPDYLDVQMNADEGPLGTRDYRLGFEAMPLDAARSFVHLSYAYGYGMAARMATQTYLATLGRDKVGFSVASKGTDGKPVLVDGVRGVLERNTMRYYLAIEAYLGALSLPADQRPERRLHDWFAATERYPLQLHEISAQDYLTMKHSELQRQSGGATGR